MAKVSPMQYSLTVPADMDDEGDRYKALTASTAAGVDLQQTSGANQKIMGVLVELPIDDGAGSVAGVITSGVVTMMAGGNITKGQGLNSAANGRVTGAAIGVAHNAMALEPASTGEEFLALLV